MRIVIADEFLAHRCSTQSEAQHRLSGELLVAYMDGIRDSEKAARRRSTRQPSSSSPAGSARSRTSSTTLFTVKSAGGHRSR